jgi:hypothetical protein
MALQPVAPETQVEFGPKFSKTIVKDSKIFLFYPLIIWTKGLGG